MRNRRKPLPSPFPRKRGSGGLRRALEFWAGKFWVPAFAGMTMMGCSANPPDDVLHHHPTIVSLNPCTDAVLAEVADEGQILALSDYSRNPASSSMDVAKARRFASVSGSVEEVLALQPDVVVGGSFLPPATVAAFRRLGLKLVQLPIAVTVEESQAQVEELGRLAGHPERARALNARIDGALARGAPPAGDAPVSAVVWQSGGMVPGRGTLIADLLRRTGFTHFSAARGMRQADVLPLELMLADPPQLILAAGDARANEDRMLAHPALAALKGTRRESFDPSLLWCGGPTIIRAVERLAEVRRDSSGAEPLPFRGGVGVGPLAGAATPPPAPPLKGRGER